MDAIDKSTNVTTATAVKVSPEFMDRFLASGHLICVLFGIPINVVIILFIIARRHLRRQPRNIIWIGIGFSNISVLFTNIFELIEFFSPESELCHIRFFLVGFPVASLLMNNCFSLVERYISIFHSVWYRRCVTIRLVSSIQSSAFILLFFLMKSHYIFGLIQVKCNVVHPFDRKIFIGFISFFLILCIIGQLTIYIMIKMHLVPPLYTTSGGNDTTAARRWRAAQERHVQQHQGSSTVPPAGNSEEIILVPEEAVRSLNQHDRSSNAIIKNRHFVRIRHEMVSRLELKATQNVILSLGFMLIFTLPWIISSVSPLICHGNVVRQALGDEEEKAEEAVGHCSLYYWAISYTRLILLISHSIYQSVCYLARSKEFCSTRGRARRSKTKNCFGAGKHRKKLIRHPPQRMKKVHRFRYRQPGNARLRFEQHQHMRNKEDYLNAG